MTQVAERHESLAAQFEAFRRDPSFGRNGAADGREAAFRRFLDRGFPTTRDEEWRFTNVAPIAQTSFVRAQAASPSAAALEPYLFPGLPAIVVVNGRVVSTPDRASMPGVDFTSAVPHHEPAGHGHRLPESMSQPSAFVDLNAAFLEEAVVITIAPRAIVAGPLQVLFVSVGTDQTAIVAPRLVIHAGEGAECAVIESYASLGTGRALTTAVTEIDLAPGAILDHVKVQRESDAAFHIARTTIRLDRASVFASRSLTFGGRITRNDIVAVLDGDGAECTLNGLYVAGGESLVDNHTSIDHAKPNCPSHEVYKGILSGRAKAVFNGKIVVELDAQKTNAKQTNKALLLSDDAQINTKPQLEIFADDVKCTHGAAIGQLDEDAMFYLRARGIAEVEARAMLIHAFAGQILDEIRHDAVRTRVQQVLDDKLAIGR